MKLKQLITGGALAATVLTLGSAQAEERNPYEGIVFCKATIVSGGDPFSEVSITLPFTQGCGAEFGSYTYWNLGSIPGGGVADSWHSKGGPGRFVAHNNGKVGAYVYLTSWAGDYQFLGGEMSEVGSVFESREEFEASETILPTPSLQGRNSDHYCLAFTRDITAKIPTWHMLNMFTTEGNFAMNGVGYELWLQGDGVSDFPDICCIGAYMGHLDAGDYMPFDVKFWAPWSSAEFRNVRFTFMVEAAPFPLWEHDFEVQ